MLRACIMRGAVAGRRTSPMAASYSPLASEGSLMRKLLVSTTHCARACSASDASSSRHSVRVADPTGHKPCCCAALPLVEAAQCCSSIAVAWQAHNIAVWVSRAAAGPAAMVLACMHREAHGNCGDAALRPWKREMQQSARQDTQPCSVLLTKRRLQGQECMQAAAVHPWKRIERFARRAVCIVPAKGCQQCCMGSKVCGRLPTIASYV